MNQQKQNTTFVSRIQNTPVLGTLQGLNSGIKNSLWPFTILAESIDVNFKKIGPEVTIKNNNIIQTLSLYIFLFCLVIWYNVGYSINAWIFYLQTISSINIQG